jgi:UDP-N-acetyl-D-glucosamine dehydrogenase
VRKVQDALNEAGRPVRGAEILIIGVAYKKDVDDLRESPALEIMDQLHAKGAIVRYHDPYCPEIRDDGHTPLGATGKSVELTDAALRSADAVVIVTDHSNVDYTRVCALARVVIDTRNACASLKAGSANSWSGARESVAV